VAAHRKALCRTLGLVRSPIIELNRAVAVGMAEGPAAALAIVDGWRASPR
jgi:predicted RNA polymerase sigma factor